MDSYLLDTSSLIANTDIYSKLDGQIFIPSIVLEELDKLKQENYNARQVIRNLKNSSVNYIIDDCIDINLPPEFDKNKNDNKILWLALKNNYTLITDDLVLQQKAQSLNVACQQISFKGDNYTGYKELIISDSLDEQTKLAHLHEAPEDNFLNLLVNEYLIIKNANNEFIEVFKWDGSVFQNCSMRNFNSVYFGKIKPLDSYQLCLIDSLLNNQMTLVKGKPGSGKTLISLSYAMNMIEKEKYSKLIIFYNPIGARSSSKLGFYPGTRDEKLLDSALGSMLVSKFGDKEIIKVLISQNKLLLLPISEIRGFDTSNLKAIVYISEAQNLNVDLMKLAIQRVGSDTKLIIDGDIDSQVDSVIFEGNQNGMRRVSEVFRGQDFYGEIELPIIYRSKIAEIADNM